MMLHQKRTRHCAARELMMSRAVHRMSIPIIASKKLLGESCDASHTRFSYNCQSMIELSRAKQGSRSGQAKKCRKILIFVPVGGTGEAELGQ